jgi:hypothetical protein
MEKKIIYEPTAEKKKKILDLLNARIESHVDKLIRDRDVKLSTDSKHEHYHSKENLVKHLQAKAESWHRKTEGWDNMLCLAKDYSPV